MRVGFLQIWRARHFRPIAVAVLLVGGMAVGLPTASASDPCADPAGVIACENSKPGTPASVWDVSGAGDSDIQGFATDISVNIGQQINFKIDTTASAYTIDIYRLGYYGGAGARKIDSVTPSAHLPQKQPNCVTDTAMETDTSTEITDCGTWAVSASWTVRSDAVSGVYIAKLTRPDNGHESQIPFVVRDDSSHSALLFKTSDATWEAYNTYGGSDFYQGAAHGRAYKVSYNRPYGTRGDNNGRDFLFSNEYPMIRFLERNGYDVSYTTDVDTDRYGSLIRNHKTFLSVGHDEYWSYGQRANVEAARDAGVNLAFFSGNEVYWRTRWEPSEDGSNTPYRTVVCYKETWSDSHIDPTSQWTGTYRDPRFTPPATGGDSPENALTGTAYMANHDDLAITVPAAQGKYRLWRGTTVASRAATGQSTTLAAHTVGYESDEDLDNGFRPAGLIDVSTTTGETPEYLQDFGTNVAPGTTTHHMTMYRAASGALVFSAGTIQYAWGLDDEHDGDATVDANMQQAVVNLFADMGIQPVTLMSGLTLASASTDTTAPVVAIASPAAGTAIARGAQVTLTGTASDTGGVVASIEVSTDGGSTWHPATGTTSWSYTFYAAAAGDLTVQVRGVDDSGNIGATPATRQFPLSGAHNLFGQRVPANPAVSDSNGVELGVRVVPKTNGFISGIRFYKGDGNTGTHTGSLWSSSGTRLATGTFTGETSGGWQTLVFATPVAVNANTAYIASYYAPNGHYADDQYAFSYTGFVAGPLTVPRSVATGRTGLYRYDGGFPDESYGDANYYVDVVFTAADDSLPSVVATAPAADSTGVDTSVKPTVTFAKPMDPATIRFSLADGGGTSVAGAMSYDSSTMTATFTPGKALAASTSYTASVLGSDPQGHAMSQAFTWSFSTDLDSSTGTLFAANAAPENPDTSDGNSVELGVKFVPAVSGAVTGVRFYAGPGNTGTHTGSIWSASGTLLGRLTFPATSTTGWQIATFDTPVAVSADTTYVASYFAPEGHYAADASFFDTTVTRGSLSAPGGSNGLYAYGPGGGFPTGTYNSTNYWVDPLFVPGASAPGATSLFVPQDAPANANWPEAQALELGVAFSSDKSGTISAVKFYKGSQNTGSHTGSLWSSTGQLLATGTFQNETATGWQTLTLSSPVKITAGTQYVESYHTTVGYYAATPGAFSSSMDNAPLHVTASGGRFLYTSSGGFPTNGTSCNFWVDVVFTPDA